MGAPVLGLTMPSIQVLSRFSPARACLGRTLPKRARQAAEREPKHHPHGLRAHRAHALDELDELSFPGVQLGLPGDSRPQREHEVTCRDRHAVAPSRPRVDPEGEHERGLPREGRIRHEPWPKGRVGAHDEGRLENRPRDEECRRKRDAPREEHVEARRLDCPEAEVSGAADPRRLHRSSRCGRCSQRGGDQQYDDRAAHRLPRSRPGPNPTPGLRDRQCRQGEPGRASARGRSHRAARPRSRPSRPPSAARRLP